MTEGDERDPGEWSGPRRQELRRALAERQRRQLRAGQVLAGILFAVVGAGVLFRLPAEWWVPAVGAVALGGLAFRLVNWKCPACGEGLPGRGSARTCPGCGFPLE